MCKLIHGSLSSRAMTTRSGAVEFTSPAMGVSHTVAQHDPTLSKITDPGEALDSLMAGNSRFTSGQMRTHDHLTAQQRGIHGQRPYAAIIRCADSRVAPEIVFDQTLGELFICGVAGNVPTPEIVASLEYAVGVLGSPLVVVMGHTNCGAVEAAIKHENSITDLPGQLPGLIAEIMPACVAAHGAEDRLAAAVELNVRNGVNRLHGDSTVIAEAVEKRRCRVVGGVYDLTTGVFLLTDG
jgi:carbonic anhydrase